MSYSYNSQTQAPMGTIPPPRGTRQSMMDPFAALQYLSQSNNQGFDEFQKTMNPDGTSSKYMGMPIQMQMGMMGNPDPTNEFMYQIPMTEKGFQEAQNHLGEGGESDTPKGSDHSRPLDVKALHQRLQTLGLQASSESLLQPSAQNPTNAQYQSLQPTQPLSPGSARSPNVLASAFQTLPTSPREKQYQYQYPDTAELRPSDSISMYRPFRGPAPPSMKSMGTSRKGGTNVDRRPGEVNGPSDEDDDDAGLLGGGPGGADYMSRGTRADWETMNPAPSDAPSMERVTMGPSEWTTGTLAGNMYTMRNRLMNEAAAAAANDHHHNPDLNRSISQHIDEASRLSAALTKLESAEEQLRTLQATLIAERVARTQMERDTELTTDDMRDCKNELASAIRALRRARDENKKTDEERRRLARCFEETKVQLYKYHEELKVRDARAKGREEGRAEAWQEAERWMGGEPPIPVNPISSVPPAVLHQTPMMNGNLPLQGGQQQYQQQSNQGQAPYQPSIPMAPDNDSPDYLREHPGDRFTNGYESQQNGQNQQHSMPQPTGPQQSQHPSQHSNYPSNGFNQSQGQNQISNHGGMSQVPPSMANQHMQPQPTGNQFQGQGQQQNMLPPQQMMPMPQNGMPPSGFDPRQHTQFMQQQQQQPQSIPPQPTGVPPQMRQRAGTMVNRTPQQTKRQVSEPGFRNNQQRNPGDQALQMPIPESMPRHHAAESYLDRMDNDPRLKQMMNGAPTKTIHSSAVPTTADGYGGLIHQDSYEKPLPDPTTQRQGGRSRAGTDARSKTHGRRFSLMDGLHAHNHNPQHQIPDGDRYPAFPHQAQSQLGHGQPQGPGANRRGGHSRHSSYAHSVNPAQYPLPASVAPSLMHTPSPEGDKPMGNSGNKRTPAQSSQARSRVAGALRGDTEIGDGELSNIEEEEQSRVYPAMNERMSTRSHPAQLPVQTPSRENRQLGPQQGQMPQMQGGHRRGQQSLGGQMPPRYAPSMPPMRSRPVPKMPAPLGGGRAGSEPHRNGPRVNRSNMAQNFGNNASTTFSDRLPEPPADDRPVGSHDIYLPPGMAPVTISPGIQDVGGPRHSALGLDTTPLPQEEEEMEMDMPTPMNPHKPRKYSIGMMSMKAPTITIQPPSSRSGPLSAQITRGPSPSPSIPQAQQPPVPATQPQDTAQPVKRETTIITEYYDQPQPHTITKTFPQAVNVSSPHRVPLPPSRSQAPTAYTGTPGPTIAALSPPETNVTTKNTRHRKQASMPNINIIDYATRQPLPLSRPTTIMEATVPPPRNATVHDEVDVQDPDHGVRASKQTPVTAASNRSSNKTAKTFDPRRVPLPPSRAATRKGSAYAATVATIDEVTEEESMKDARSKHRYM